MDALTRLSLRRPVSTVLALIALFVFGLSSLLTFEMELIPEISVPMIVVYTTYKGADAETVDKLITSPIEEFGSKMQGMYNVTSTTTTGSSRVMFSFNYGTNMDQTFMDFKSDLETLVLPDGCDRPRVIRLKLDSPFMSIQVNSDSGKDVLTYVNNTIKPRIERQAGVAEVNIYGGKEEYIRVLLNERLMDQYSVTMDSVSAAINSTDYNIPASTMRQGSLDIRLSATSVMTSMEELENIPVQTGTGAIVTLRDIADISYSVRKADSINRHNGSENIRIDVTKKQNSSTVSVARQVKAEIERLNAEDSGVTLLITENSADDIVKTLLDVGMTLVIGVLLSMFTLFLFFGDIKASLIVGSSMPISLLATLIIMALAKLQLNVMTMGGLVISIGMMVDSSIVVLESCFRAQERGLDFRESALQGTKEVTASIVASTITTCVVYAPVALVGGYISEIFQGTCFTIIFSMITSLLVALTFIPLFFSFYKPVEKKDSLAVHVMEKITARYGRSIRKIIPRKAAVILVTLIMLGVTALMAMNMEIKESSVDKKEFTVTVESRIGTAMEVADENARKYEEILLNDPEIRDVDYSVTDNIATINAYIDEKSGKATAEKVYEYNVLFHEETGVDIRVEEVSDSTSGSSTVATVTLTGEDYSALKEQVYEAIEPLSSIEGVVNVSTQLQTGAPEAKIHIDPKKAMDAGLSPQNVAVFIANVNGGIQALKIKSEGEEYNVRVEYPEGRYDDIYKLMNIKLTGQTGKVVTLGEIASLDYEEAPGQIMKNQGRYSLDISLTTSEDEKSRVQKEADEIIENLTRAGGATAGEDAGTLFLKNELKKLAMAVAAAIFLVFLAMAMQFESARFSGMVMMSIPFCLVGSVALEFIVDRSVTTEAVMGVLMLAGIVVNDGILFVDTANGLKQKYPVNEALARAGELRLRPILMTTLTTVLSMIPLVSSANSDFNLMAGTGLVIIGGLMASTTLILFLLPTYYTLFMGKRAKLENLRKFPPEGWSEEDSSRRKRRKKAGHTDRKKHDTEEITVENAADNKEDTEENREDDKAEIKEDKKEENVTEINNKADKKKKKNKKQYKGKEAVDEIVIEDLSAEEDKPEEPAPSEDKAAEEKTAEGKAPEDNKPGENADKD